MLEIDLALIRQDDVTSPNLIPLAGQRQMSHCAGVSMMGFVTLSLIEYVVPVVVAAVDQLIDDVGRRVVQLNIKRI